MRVGFGEKAEKIDAVLPGVLAKRQIEDRDRRFLPDKDLNGGGGAVGGQDWILSLEQPRHLLQHDRIVVHDQDRWLEGEGFGGLVRHG